MQGAGNRIVVVDARESTAEPPSTAVLTQLADESTGPGFDQLMWLMAATDSAATASYRVFNADGSEVEQCGNGIRCIAILLAAEDPQSTQFVLQSPAGVIRTEIVDEGQVAVDMGPPVFEPDDIPFVADSMATTYPLEAGEQTLEIAAVSMGNPHCVVQVDDVHRADVAQLGPLLEHHERFPQRTNVGFLAIQSRHTVDLRVHERGTGETLACGTGACAAMVAAHRLGLVDDAVTVRVPGGQLMVKWRGDADSVTLIGDACLVAEGNIDL
ncbi:MAG: diaminopimelate epimerase [Pseudomonadota bacterium]